MLAYVADAGRPFTEVKIGPPFKLFKVSVITITVELRVVPREEWHQPRAIQLDGARRHVYAAAQLKNPAELFQRIVRAVAHPELVVARHVADPPELRAEQR